MRDSLFLLDCLSFWYFGWKFGEGLAFSPYYIIMSFALLDYRRQFYIPNWLRLGLAAFCLDH